MSIAPPASPRVTLRRLLAAAASRPIIITAIKVALVVGTVLNVINQGGRVTDGLPIAWGQLALNYFVPYCVSSYSAASNQLRRLKPPL